MGDDVSELRKELAAAMALLKKQKVSSKGSPAVPKGPRPYETCGWRDVTPLQDYANNPALARKFLAKILDESGFLDNYKMVPMLNECVMSYPATKGTDSGEWFGVYLQDSDGNKSWITEDSNGNPVRQNYVYYFKTVKGDDGEYEIDQTTHRFSMPPQLVGLKPCALGPKGTCIVPPKETTPKKAASAAASPAAETPKKAKKVAAPSSSQEGAAPVVQIPAAELAGAVEALNLGTEEETVKGSVTQEDLAKLDEKTLLKWMAEHMYFEDVAGCLRSSKLSKDEADRIVKLMQEGKEAVVDETSAAVNAASFMPSDEVRKMFKAITKQELVAEIKRISNMNDQKQAIVQLCQRAGLNYTLDTSSKIPKIIGPDGKNVRPDSALDDCARAEAREAHVKLGEQVERATNRARKMIAGKYPAYVPPAPSGSGEPPAATSLTESQTKFVAEFIDDLLDLIKNDEYDDFVAAINNTGIVIELREDGIYRNNVYIEIDSEEMDDLIDEAALAYIKKFNVAFGKSRISTFGMTKKRRRVKGCKRMPKGHKKPFKVSKIRSNFKCAAKKCKKSANYRKCMTTSLRRIYRKNGMGDGTCGNTRQVVPAFGKKKNLFIQAANARSRRKGTVGTFGRWCRRNHLDTNGKVSLRCINKAKKSGNTKLIRRAVYAQNIKAYAGAKKKRRVSIGRRTRPRLCKRLKKRSCRSNPQCRWSGRRKGQKVKPRCVRRRKVYEGPALPPKRYSTSFGRIKKKKSRSIPNNKKLGPRLKGYSGKEPKLSVFVRINGKMYEPRVSKSTKKGYLKATIKGKKYHFKPKGPEKYVTLTPMKATRRRASFRKRKSPRNRSQKYIYRKRSTHPKRKSPRVSATSVSVGTVKKGVDGNQWKVKTTKNGVKRWVKI
uniref:Uncharacterized protein n=1 Tax=viral metagenome TaxID=1070528 RepID=A0A6C0AZB1_9ZZZZ